MTDEEWERWYGTYIINWPAGDLYHTHLTRPEAMDKTSGVLA